MVVLLSGVSPLGVLELLQTKQDDFLMLAQRSYTIHTWEYIFFLKMQLYDYTDKNVYILFLVPLGFLMLAAFPFVSFHPLEWLKYKIESSGKMQFPLASCNTTGRHTGNKKQIGKGNIIFHYKLIHANTVCKKKPSSY